jgi:hypothetical protein
VVIHVLHSVWIAVGVALLVYIALWGLALAFFMVLGLMLLISRGSSDGVRNASRIE